jgi:hypothetical protein
MKDISAVVPVLLTLMSLHAARTCGDGTSLVIVGGNDCPSNFH